MKTIKPLYFIWLIALILVVMITLKYRGKSTKFYGLAETREISIRSENASVVKKVHVIPGQTVSKGELLIELQRPELNKAINQITHELYELKAQHALHSNSLQSQIKELKADKAAKISNINYRIKQLQAQYDVNRDFTSELKSLRKETSKTKKKGGRNPLQIEIEGLKKELQLMVKPIEAKINALEKELASTEDPLEIRIEKLNTELTLLLVEKNQLYIFAQAPGIISSVTCKEGEQISPFDNFLALHPKAPSYVRGYVHEFVYTKVSIGMKVNVISPANPSHNVIGEVVGIGTKIVEYPHRLKRTNQVEVYGREVQIKIPEDNKLLFGEKVLVSLDNKGLPYVNLANADSFLTKSNEKEGSEPGYKERKVSSLVDIKIDKSLKNIAPIEASGAIYLSDIKKYLIVSDSTRDSRAVLYLMDDQGTIEDEVLIHGSRKVDDMEAITKDREGNIYIACSQKTKKKGGIPEKRKLLIKVARDRVYFRLSKKVNLYDLLKEAAKKQKQAPWARFINSGEDRLSLNIEGIFYHDGGLYLGFLKPFKDNKAVILKITDIDSVFENNRVDSKNVELWNEFNLKENETGIPTGISDLYLHNKRLYILSYAKIRMEGKNKKFGNLWKYDIESKKLSNIMVLDYLKPEGIAFNSNTDEFLITFDYGSKRPSKIMKIRNL